MCSTSKTSIYKPFPTSAGTYGAGVSGIAVSTRFRRSPRTFRVLNTWIFSFTFCLAMLVDDTWDCIEVGPANHLEAAALSVCVCVDSRAWPVGGEMAPSFFVLKNSVLVRLVDFATLLCRKTCICS
jgi:hypothetical protein